MALLFGGKGLSEAGYESIKTEAEENIRSISNQVNHGVGIVGDRGSIADRYSVINVVGDYNSFGNITK